MQNDESRSGTLMTEARSHAEIQALLRDEIAALQELMQARLREIATLTGMLEQPASDSGQLAQLERRHALEMQLLRLSFESAQHGPRPGTAPIERQVEGLRASPLFKTDWYLEHHRDVAEAGIDPAEHYVRAGAFERRNPGPDFDTMQYYLANPDVAEAGWPALVHYALFGQVEGRALAP